MNLWFYERAEATQVNQFVFQKLNLNILEMMQ